MQHVKHQSNGFTLVELLITIVIIGILSTLGIVAFQSTQKKSRDLGRKANLHTVAKALETYMNDKGFFPPSSPDGKILWCGTEADPDAVSCPWGYPLTDAATAGEDKTVYLAALPKDSNPAQTFFYEAVPIDGVNKGYRLYAKLENTKDPDIPSSGQYDTNCGATTTQYCNYVLASETVPAPSPYVIVMTPTNSPSSKPTNTPTHTPTHIPTPTAPSCLATGAVCSIGSQCCTGICCAGKCWNNAHNLTCTSTGLIDLWHMNEPSGTTVFDSIRGRNGTAYGTTIVDGKLGKARSFTDPPGYGGASYINLGSANPLGDLTGPLTLSAWIKPVTTNGSVIISEYCEGYCGDAYFGLNNGHLFFSDGTTLNNTSDSIVTPNTWHHVAYTYDGTRGTMYLDGVASPDTTPAHWIDRCIGNISIIGSVKTIIGAADCGNQCAERGFNGIIDEVGIYNRALNASEVRNCYCGY